MMEVSSARRRLIESLLKNDEVIVCENATVVMDSSGNLNYYSNDIPLNFLETEGEN